MLSMTRLLRSPICVLALGAAACLITACGGAKTVATAPDVCLGKGAVPPPPVFTLDYPPNGSTNIPTSAGVLIEVGADNGQYPNATVSVTSASGPVPLGTPTAVPSPLPTPFATPSPNVAQTYVALPMPALLSNTTYTVTANYMAYADNPPSCTGPASQTLGTFTTGP